MCIALATVVLILAGCSSPKVLAPPRVDLDGYGTIGIVVFSSNSTGGLNDYATRHFLQSVQAGQPGVRVLELGEESRVLSAVKHDSRDDNHRRHRAPAKRGGNDQGGKAKRRYESNSGHPDKYSAVAWSFPWV